MIRIKKIYHPRGAFTQLTIFGTFDIIITRTSKYDNKERSGDMITALNVANNILERAFEEDIDITPMKLQKLLYCVYKEYIKETGYSLFEENFEAWQYGPVLPTVYREFSHRGANHINKFAKVEDGSYSSVRERDGSDFKRVIDTVWDKYKDYSGTTLSAFTHKEGTAWRKAVEARRNYLLDSEIKSEENYVA